MRVARRVLERLPVGNHASEHSWGAMREIDPHCAVEASRPDGVITAAGAEAGSIPADFT